MRTLTRRARRLGVAAAGLAAACALTVPAVAAHAATGSYTPNPHQWYFSQWHVQQQVWPVSQGAGVTVGVVDSGVQPIPDLQGVLKPGADMLGSGNGEHDYAADGGHGTGIAELIAGQGVGTGLGGGGPVGIAPQARILPVHAIDPGSSASVANGIKYAASHGAKVINLSLGDASTTATSCEPVEQAAVSYALARDVVVVASSGNTKSNGTTPQEPATCAGVLAVGGVEQDGSLWQGSTQGSYVSVAAPGDHMYDESSNGQQYTLTTSGTSDSSALVSGAAALIRSKYPSMPWYTVDQRLIGTAIATGSVPNNGTGYGIIDIAKAIDPAQYPVKSSSPNPPYIRYQNWLKANGKSGAPGGQAAPSGGAGASKGGGSGVVWIILGVVVAVIVIIVVVLVIVLSTRSRNRRGPRNPGGGGYPPGPYGPPPGQYQPPGPQYPQGPYQAPPRHPQQGQYPPPRQ